MFRHSLFQDRSLSRHRPRRVRDRDPAPSPDSRRQVFVVRDGRIQQLSEAKRDRHLPRRHSANFRKQILAFDRQLDPDRANRHLRVGQRMDRYRERSRHRFRRRRFDFHVSNFGTKGKQLICV